MNMRRALRGLEALLLLKTLPKLGELKKLLEAENYEEAVGIVGNDILSVRIIFRDTELKKYENIPANLKSALVSVFIRRKKELCDEAVQSIYYKYPDSLRNIAEIDWDFVESKVQEIIDLKYRQ